MKVDFIKAGREAVTGVSQVAVKNSDNLSKNAGDLIFGSLKNLLHITTNLPTSRMGEIIEISKGNGELAQKSKQMKKLIEQNKRLMEKH